MRDVSGEFFIFQQDSARAHRARDTVRLLQQSTPTFFPPDLWPPNSPDLNPVDYKIWSVLQQRVYQWRVHNTDELKQRLLQAWHSIDHNIVDNAIGEWRRRLRACMRANGGTSKCCITNNRHSCLTVYQLKRFKYDTVFCNSVVICDKFELLIFPR